MSYYFRIAFILGMILLISCKKDIPIDIQDNLGFNNVNPFIGTGGHGHTYPGATAPFGMLQISPDNGISKWDWCSGYHYSDSIAIGFSQLHLSGTGIGDLTDVRLMPINRKVDLTAPVKNRFDIPYKSLYSHDSEVSEPGYYKVHLEDPNIDVELTTTVRRGVHRYTYIQPENQSIILDLNFEILWDRITQSSIEQLDDYTLVGFRHSTGWAKNQKLFYALQFTAPIKSIDLVADGAYVTDSKSVEGVKTLAQLYFDNENSNQIEVNVGVSSVSVANAIDHIRDGSNLNFDDTRTEVASLWKQHLNVINIETPNEELKKIFYTALYHTQLAPVTFSDSNGEFRTAMDTIKNADDFTQYSTLSLWDTFRAEHPLLTLTQPQRVSDMIRSMLVYYEDRNRLPVWTLYGNETNTMTGYHSIPVIVEAYAKGLTNFDVTLAYEAMKQTMMQDERGLEHYKKYGFAPWDLLDESVTITLEYAYNDWCVAQLAKALDKEEDYEYFLNRSRAYTFLFDKETGFMRGRSSVDDSWHLPFDPKFSSHRVHADYTEGNAWQHSWFVLHDPEHLIELHGGNEPFTDKLQQLFTESSEITGENVSADISGLIGQYAHGNEPSHHIAYMFNFAKKPWMTQYWVREILKTQYTAQPDGLSGNEDCGQMSAWYVFSAMGLYPYSPASANYEIGSPLFEKSVINLAEGKSFTIIAEQVSDENYYIQEATLNGKPFSKTTLSHQEITNGGTLVFKMGPEPNKSWGLN
jgi:predicted alpha-1,2-mannosidase